MNRTPLLFSVDDLAQRWNCQSTHVLSYAFSGDLIISVRSANWWIKSQKLGGDVTNLYDGELLELNIFSARELIRRSNINTPHFNVPGYTMIIPGHPTTSVSCSVKHPNGINISIDDILIDAISVKKIEERFVFNNMVDAMDTGGAKKNKKQSTDSLPLKKGRPSIEKEIFAALEKLGADLAFWNLPRVTQVEKVANQCNKSVGDKGWGSRAIQSHIAAYEKNQRNAEKE